MKIYFLLIFVLSTLYSCDNSINGIIVDNFNKPVENVSIRISGSDFKTESKSDGKFYLDYVAGKFIIEFEKDNYIPIERHLEIAEHSKYPLGQILMIRLPIKSGLYFCDNSDYINLPSIQLIQGKSHMIKSFFTYDVNCDYFLPEDTLYTISIDSVMRLYNYTNKNLILMETENGKVASISKGIGTSSVYGTKVKSANINNLGHGLIEITFKPEFDKTYAIINVIDNGYQQRLDKMAYSFKVSKK